MSNWQINNIRRQLDKLKQSGVEKGTEDCFDDGMVPAVEDEDGQPILDPVRLMELGYSV